jgi:hypothetical protein
MSETMRSLAKKSPHSFRKNLKAPKKHHFRHGISRSRSRPVPVKKPPSANGNRLVFPQSKLSGVFEDNCSRVPPIENAMPKEDLMPFWHILETIENYDTTKISQDMNKRGKISCFIVCILFIGILVIGFVAVGFLIAVAFFLGVCALMTIFFFVQKKYFGQ